MLKKFRHALAASLGVCSILHSLPAGADDIDIFTGASAGSAMNPRILIVLDNTSNWARQSQQWPDGGSQGQSEVAAIKQVISKLSANVSIGLMEFVTDGNANQDGGFVRLNLQPMTSSAKSAFGTQLDTIYNDINGTHEKRNSNTPYGDLMFDVYNYLAGANSYSGPATNSASADGTAYSSKYGTFLSPLSADTTCGQTVMIFIGNPNASGPASDISANTTALKNLGGVTTQLGLPNFTASTTTTTTKVGQTAQCYASNTAATAELPSFSSTCASYTNGCSIGSALNDGSMICPSGKASYAVIGTNQVITNKPTGSSTTDANPLNADEWVRFMHDKGIPVASTTIRPPVTTYTIDVYNKQPNATHTSLLLSMARVGGGKYFAAKNQQSIVDALDQILGEVLAVNSTFASTSLPVNSTNRSQNENQVFIGMFRPDPDAKPRWFGNLKRYQLVQNGAAVDLGDVNGNLAVNNNTGFITPCAVSWWTSDSGSYWKNLGINPDPASGCSSASAYSDSPDGPQVEKGAVAQVLRNGNQPPSTTNSPSYAVSRTIYTRSASGASLIDFTAANSGLPQSLVDFIRGADVNDEKGTGSTTTTTRPSIHGDVIHSRPLPLNYGTNGVMVFYGANDGYFRAVEANTGKERWSFIAPEFFSRLQRLKDQTPLVNYPNVAGTGDLAATGTQKDYFFDGSTGVYQNADNSKIWIYPTMRRGGRMIYGLDATSLDSPKLMWAAGCPNLGNDTGCSLGMSAIGQTWSTPSAALVKGYSETKPVLVVGGGYDNCEDANTGAPTCTGSKGGVVYILDAAAGNILASFNTERSVVGDISMIDIDYDGMPDYAYAADMGGNLYRIDFVDGPKTLSKLAPSQWQMYKVAYTTGGGRKFMFAPALLYSKGSVYLALGSGDREHPLPWQYPYDNVTNRFYVSLDDLSVKDSTQARSLDTLTDYSGSTDCNSPPALAGSTGLKGWFMTLRQGEQVVTSAQIVGGSVLFSTNRPIKGSAASCSTALGEARGYNVSLFNASGALGVDGFCGGTRSSPFIGGGLPPSPVLATGVPVNGRNVSVIIGAVPKDGGSGAAISPQKIRPSISSVRKRTYTYVKGQ
jgi:type IV pilus assembly protein PilY1